MNFILLALLHYKKYQFQLCFKNIHLIILCLVQYHNRFPRQYFKSIFYNFFIKNFKDGMKIFHFPMEAILNYHSISPICFNFPYLNKKNDLIYIKNYICEI